MVRYSNKIFAVIVIMAVLFGIAKGAFYLRAKQAVDKFIADAAPYAEISYQSLETSLEGIIKLEQLAFVPVGFTQPVTAAAVIVHAPDPLFFILDRKPVAEGGLPKQLKVTVHNIEIDLTGEMAQQLETQRIMALQSNRVEQGVCKLGSAPSLQLISELGVDKLVISGSLGYVSDSKRNRLDIEGNVDVRGIESTEIRLSLQNISAANVANADFNLPALEEFVLNIKIDPEFGARQSKYCAEKIGQSEFDYTENRVRELLQNLANQGVGLGLGLSSAIRDFYTNWGELEIGLRPEKAVGLLVLLKTPKEQMAELLGLELIVNDTLITDISFDIKGLAGFISDKKEQKKPPPRRVRYKNVFREIKIADLAKYRDRLATITTNLGLVRKGVITELGEKEISLEQRQARGNFVQHIPLEDVAKVKIRFRVKVKPVSPSPASAAQKSGHQSGDATKPKQTG
jgi:hypothetical protein